MDLRKIKKLIELIKKTGIAEIEIHEGEESVRITQETHKTPSSPIFRKQEKKSKKNWPLQINMLSEHRW